MRNWLKQLASMQRGTGSVPVILGSLIGAIVGLYLVANLTPEIETVVTAFTAGTHNAITEALMTLAVWVIPVGALAGIMMATFNKVKGT